MSNSIELWRTGWVISHNGNSGEVSELWVGDAQTPDKRLMFWALEALMINCKRSELRAQQESGRGCSAHTDSLRELS